MPCHTRMKSMFLQGLLWLFLLQLGFMAVSLEPGYLDFDNLPDTNFSCIGRVVGGYYADTATSCQMFHVCTLGQNNETMDIRFLCLNGTVFEQSTRVCERIDEVDCEKSENYYHLNNELYGGMDPLIIRGESEPPATTPSTTTTTLAATSATPNTYYATPKQTTARQQISSIYASDSPSDIRFDPKIINLQLNSDPSLGANIKPISYQQQSYNDDQSHHTIVTTHSYKNDFKGQNLKPTDVNYEFEYQDQEQYNPNNRKNYQVANLPVGYSPSAAELEDYGDDVFKGSTYRTIYPVPKIVQRGDSSTYKTPITFAPPSNPQSQYSFERTDVPVKHQGQQQQPQPITPSPIAIFSALSSPAPFAHPHHLETKRNTDHHKIKKSFSLSISDQNGKELITVKNTPIDEVTFLPIFEDVPRLHKRRPKREIEQKKVFKADPEAAEALRFLADWYTKYEKTTKVSAPLTPEFITEINDQLSASEEEESEELEQESKEDLNQESEEKSLEKETQEELEEKEPESKEKLEEEETQKELEEKELESKENSEEQKIQAELDKKEPESKEKLEENVKDKREDLKNDISDLQTKEVEYYYDDDDYYYDDIEEGDNKTSTNITVSHIELQDHLEADKNITSNNIPDDNLKESNQVSTSKSSQQNKSYLDEYIDDNYEPHIYQKDNSTLEDKELKKKAELDINEIPKDVTIAPDVLYEYVDDNYEPLIRVQNNSKDVENDAGNKTFIEVLTTASTAVTLPTMVTTTKLPNSTEADVNDIITTDPVYSSTEETTKIVTTVYSIAKNVVDIDEEVPQIKISEHENHTIDNHIDLHNSSDSHNETLEDIVTEYVTGNNFAEESHSTALLSIAADLSPSTTEDIPNTTTLSTEQTTAGISTELSLTSTTTLKPDNIEVPITTSSYTPELLETISENAYVISKITSTTMQTPLVTEKLDVMIKDIEVETKSIAATIVMPETNGKVPSSTQKLESTVTEYTEELATTQTPTVEATVTTTTQVSTSITTPKLLESTKRPYFVRGRHNYFSRKPIISTTTTRSTHRFGLQHRRRFDIKTERPTIFKEKKTINSSVNDVHKEEINDTQIKETTPEIYKNISSTEHINVTSTEVPIQNDHQDLAPPPKITEETITDASLSKSANPTLAKETKYFLATTPISKHIRVKFKKERINKKYVFTCFNRKINKFYSDPRDCRLFHYCSQGYTSKQLVDMKFVCDLGTYFDDNKLICTEEKPARCL